MTRPWWRHPVLGALAALLVAVGIGSFAWGFVQPGWWGSPGFIAVHALAMVGSAYLLVFWVRNYIVGWERPDTARRVAEVRASGSEMASGWCNARVGWTSFRGPLLRVGVYPGGIVLQPLFSPARAIRASELQAVDDAGSVLGVFGPASVQIRHAAPDVHSGVRLHIDREGQLARAIRSLQTA